MAVLCIDCKHIDNRHAQRFNAMCRHPMTTSPVDGKAAPELCHIMRAEGHPCGPDGKLFSAAPELPEERR
jgi:hypothetical protein